MVETGSKQQSQFELLQDESRKHGIDVAQLAVDTLTTLPQMQEFLDGYAASKNLSHDPKKDADFLPKVKNEIKDALTDRPHRVFNRWITFLNTGALPATPEPSALQPARAPRQGRTLT